MHSALGEMLSRTDARGATAFDYDRLGRPTRRTHPGSGVAQRSWDPANGEGLLGVRSYGAGFSETYAYNSDARLGARDRGAARGERDVGDLDARRSRVRSTRSLDTFAYGPDGARHHRRSQWAGDGATRTEDNYYAGAYEKTHRPDGSVVERTRLGVVVHVRTTPAPDPQGNRGSTTEAGEYLHRDHLGSVESVTDASGNELAAMAHDPYGDCRRPDWTGRLTEASSTAPWTPRGGGRRGDSRGTSTWTGRGWCT